MMLTAIIMTCVAVLTVAEVKTDLLFARTKGARGVRFTVAAGD